MAQKQMKPKDVHIIHLAKLVSSPQSILYKEADLLAYDCDGFTIERHLPRAVVFQRIQKRFQRLSNIAHRITCHFLLVVQEQD